MTTSADMKFFESMEKSDLSTNGGHRSDNLITTNVKQNTFLNTQSSERVAGSRKYRFIYLCNHNTSLGIAYSPNLWLDRETPAGDYVFFFQATQGMTQASITGSETKFTVYNATSDIAVGGNTFVGTFAASELTGSIVAGAAIRITNKLTPDAVTGTEEIVTVTGTPSVAGNQVSFTFTPVTANAYTVLSGTRASKVLVGSNIVATVGTLTKSSSAGTLDQSTYPPIACNNGTIEETFTLTFSNATQFTCSGARIGAIASGDRNTLYSPNNPRCSLPYFTLPVGIWGGTWANGDTVTIPTHDSSLVVCECRVTPAGTPSYSNNGTTLAGTIESAT